MSLLFAIVGLAATACDRGPRSGPIADAPERRDVLYVAEGPESPAKVGESNTVQLRIKPASGWKINKEFDWSFEFPSEGASVEPKKAGADQIDLTDAVATISVAVTPAESGEVLLPAKGNFSVCNDDKCELYQGVDLTFKVPAAP